MDGALRTPNEPAADYGIAAKSVRIFTDKLTSLPFYDGPEARFHGGSKLTRRTRRLLAEYDAEGKRPPADRGSAA